MKKRLIVGLFSFLMVCLVFAGCALTGGPASADIVLGNGGLTVQKGEWLYFAGGYESYANLEAGHKNKTGSVEVGALYRTKLSADGNVEADEDGYPTNYQRVISKLVGYEYGSIYIFGNQVFFASPNTAKDRLGNYHFDQISFFKSNLDGTGLKEIYVTNTYSASGKFVFNQIDGKVILTVLDGTNLVKVDANGSATILAENILGVEMVAQRDFAQTSAVPALKDFVFATRARTEAEGSGSGVSGNILEKINVQTGVRSVLKSDADTTYALKGITYGRVYYSKTNTISSPGYIFSSSFNGTSAEMQHTVLSDITNFVPFQDAENGSFGGFVFTKSAKVYYQIFNNMFDYTEILSSSLTVLHCKNGKVYHKNSNGGISVVSVSSLEISILTNVEGTLKIDSATNIDFGNSSLYFLNKPTNASNNYLYALSLVNPTERQSQLLTKPISSDLLVN